MCGEAKPALLTAEISDQIKLTCGCRVQRSTVFSHRRALIGGKSFHAGEPLIPGKRCGSVIVRVMGDGRSLSRITL